MKKSVVVSGFAVTLLLGLALGVQADSMIKEVKAYINSGLKLTLDGESWTPKDPDGIPQSPLVYNGSTYLPLRSVGELTGLAIDWDPDTTTVSIRRPDAVAPTEGVPYKDDSGYGLVEYSLINKTLRMASDILLVERRDHAIALPVGSLPGNRSFRIGYSMYGAAQKVKGRFSVESSDSGAVIRFAVSDRETGKSLYQSPVLQFGDQPLDWEADVSGVKELTIEAIPLSSPGKSGTALIQDLKVVAERDVPESMFDITQPNHELPESN